MYTLQELENHVTELRQKLSHIEKKLSLQNGYHLDEELPDRFPTKKEVKQSAKSQKPLGKEPTAEELREQAEEENPDNK